MEESDIRNENESNNLIPSTEINKEIDSVASIAKLLKDISLYPNLLRREFRGEMMYEGKEGDIHWVQGTKPTFVRVDYSTNKPIKIKKKMPWGETVDVYIPNDEAIDEVISMLKFIGINQINPVGFNTPDNYLDDLREFECKLAGLLALKQRAWGIDKELLPMVHQKLKTIIQDVRSLSINGNLMKTIQTTTQRIEQYIEGEGSRKKKVEVNPYG